MTKLSRITQPIFAGNAPETDTAVFGTMKTTPVYTTDVAASINTSVYGEGWKSAIELGYAPFIEDMNTVQRELSYQIAYAQQEGVQEWGSDTTYYIGSMVKVNTESGAQLYVSKTDNNTGNLPSNTTYWKLLIDSTTDLYANVSLSNLNSSGQSVLDSIVPAGVMLPYGGTSAPSGFLMCDGSAVSRSTYSRLFSAIGTSYGAGDGSTTFNLPDFRDRVAFMRADKAVGQTSAGSIPDHRHQSWGVQGSTGWDGGGARNGAYNTTYASQDTSLFGSSLYSQTVNKVIPSHVSCNYIIKY